jgi:uncharacterized protein GlcG (DUF336 family)
MSFKQFLREVDAVCKADGMNVEFIEVARNGHLVLRVRNDDAETVMQIASSPRNSHNAAVYAKCRARRRLKKSA